MCRLWLYQGIIAPDSYDRRLTLNRGKKTDRQAKSGQEKVQPYTNLVTIKINKEPTTVKPSIAQEECLLCASGSRSLAPM